MLDAYKNGIESLTYDFMISDDGIRYYWMRITARIFTWEEDNSVRMFSYRQNIDAQKTQEKKLLAKLQEAKETVADGTGWLSLDELKSAMEE